MDTPTLHRPYAGATKRKLNEARTEPVAARVTPSIKDVLVAESAAQGVSLSEHVLNILAAHIARTQ